MLTIEENPIRYVTRCLEAREKYLSKCYWHCHKCDSVMDAISVFPSGKCCSCNDDADGTLGMSYEDGSGHCVSCPSFCVGHQGILEIAALADQASTRPWHTTSYGTDGYIVTISSSTAMVRAIDADKPIPAEVQPPPRCGYATGKPVKRDGKPVRTISEEALNGYVKRRTRAPSDWRKLAETGSEMLDAEAVHLRRTCSSMFGSYPTCSVTGESVSVEARVVDGYVAAVFVCAHCAKAKQRESRPEVWPTASAFTSSSATWIYRVAPGESIKARMAVRIRDDGLVVQCVSDAEYNFVGFAVEDSDQGKVAVKR